MVCIIVSCKWYLGKFVFSSIHFNSVSKSAIAKFTTRVMKAIILGVNARFVFADRKVGRKGERGYVGFPEGEELVKEAKKWSQGANESDRRWIDLLARLTEF